MNIYLCSPLMHFRHMFNSRYKYLLILLLSINTYLCTELCQVYHYFGIVTKWYYALGTISIITWAIWEANRLLEPVFLKKNGSKNKIKTLSLFFVVGTVLTTIITCIIVLIASIPINGHTFEETIVPLKLNLIYAWLVNLLFHLINTILFYFKEYKLKWIEAEELKRMSAQAELQLVKNQINPHFLFNNLNVLSALVIQNNTEANKFIEEFSKVYRYILDHQDKELVELKRELHFIDPYIFLLQKRFPESIYIHMEVPGKYGNYYIIPAAIQMLIENAIKHNVASSSRPLHINISLQNDTITVSNNKHPKKSVERSTGIGLQNIVKRYAIVSNRAVKIDNSEDFFSVDLPLININ